MSIKKAKKLNICSISKFCQIIKLTRDAYYKMSRRNEEQANVREMVLKLVLNRRRCLPREGVRKLYRAISDDLNDNNIRFGRDRLFDLLREENMLVRPKKKYIRTTNSWHRFHKYPNLIKDMVINKPNQVWVSDITYIKLLKGHCYLALITDAYSRKIVGYDLSDSLELSGCLRALKSALRKLPPGYKLIHHSDRGIQYCSNVYVNSLKKNKISISMTEDNHCYENAIAERVNGILKDEFFLDQSFIMTSHARKVSNNAIELYNEKRLHLSLNLKTPNMVHKNVA
ncbi:IS3 family transposase [candidate division KSB1 bacterium]